MRQQWRTEHLRYAAELLAPCAPEEAQRVSAAAPADAARACTRCALPLRCDTTHVRHTRLRRWRRGGVRTHRRPASLLLWQCSVCKHRMKAAGAHAHAARSAASRASAELSVPSHSRSSRGRKSREQRRRQCKHKRGSGNARNHLATGMEHSKISPAHATLGAASPLVNAAESGTPRQFQGALYERTGIQSTPSETPSAVTISSHDIPAIYKASNDAGWEEDKGQPNKAGERDTYMSQSKTTADDISHTRHYDEHAECQSERQLHVRGNSGAGDKTDTPHKSGEHTHEELGVQEEDEGADASTAIQTSKRQKRVHIMQLALPQQAVANRRSRRRSRVLLQIAPVRRMRCR